MVSRAKFTTGEPDRAVPVLSEFFSKVRMNNPTDEFEFDIESTEDELMSFVHFHLRSPASVSSVDMSGSLTVGQVVEGVVHLTQGKKVIDTTSPFIYPDAEVEGRWDDVTMSAVRLSVPETLKFARAVVGDDRFRLELRGSSPVDPDHGRTWSALVSYTRQAFSDDGPVMDSEIVRSNAFGHLVSVMLATFPNNAMDAAGTTVISSVVPGAVRRAVMFMDENAHRPITVVEIAEAARLSVRGLQYAFQNALGTSPLAYLRRVRLSKAHADLVAADPSRGATVRDVAHAWGFVHLGRFAEQYREAYGVSPRRTLDT